MTNPTSLGHIANVAISGTGELLLTPEGGGDPSYQYVYRAGAGVYWVPSIGSFKSTQRKDWPYSKWFEHMLGAVESELGLKLVIGKNTTWTNVPPDVQTELLHVVI